MGPEDRNTAIARTIEIVEENGSITYFKNTDSDLAIRECDKLARAWDAEEKWLINKQLLSSFGENCPITCRDIMFARAEFINPPPKGPLEELEEWVNENNVVSLAAPSSGLVSTSQLLAKIRRLRGKK